jgi:NAD(P)-dependent dehydrogenase (short-subunit alcohol dehydrogenase family)
MVGGPRKPRLEGKIVLVTGAGSRPGDGVGTGKAMSVLFAREGARVVLMDINESQVAETMSMIRDEGGEASVFIGDVTKERDCQAAVQGATSRFGPLTTLVNNVAVTAKADVSETSEKGWDHLLNTNLKSAMFMTKHSVPVMAQRGGGSIINISSIVALRGHPNQSAYSASKGALISLTTLWAMEQGRNGIRVNCICPGNIYTPVAVSTFSADGRPMSPEQRWARANLNPLGLEGDAWDVAWAAVFLASDEARWISGVTLPVDGGYLAGTPQWGYNKAGERPGEFSSAQKEATTAPHR